ncbi:hypothetical protein PR048_000124 [Dryococelus australis]|uniref:Uncharacterized protein n=1 Tax=Dryococelus australis TaxID=614101 RepID=A0ABQ9IEC4_9NEOP|nr:hypothetical protein PR048_000124 [Dryococelus australis]
MLRLLSIFHNIDQRGWDQNLPELCLTFNLVPHSATGFSKCKIFLGRELPVSLLNICGIPLEIMDTVIVNSTRFGMISIIIFKWVNWYFDINMSRVKWQTNSPPNWLGPITGHSRFFVFWVLSVSLGNPNNEVV